VREDGGDWGRGLRRVEELYSGGTGWLDPRCESLQQCGFIPKTVSYPGSQAKTRTKRSTARRRSLCPRRPPSCSKRNGACRATGRPELPLPLHSASDIDAHPTCLTSCYCQPSHTSRRAPNPDPLTCIKLPPSSPHAATDASCLAKLCQLARSLGVSCTASPPCPPIGRQTQLCLACGFPKIAAKVLSLGSVDSTEKWLLHALCFGASSGDLLSRPGCSPRLHFVILTGPLRCPVVYLHVREQDSDA
jgi:hypothetical protein